MTFSARTAWDLRENALAGILRRKGLRGEPITDLTIANPAACGLHLDAQSVFAPLAELSSLRYEPNPLGAESARSAVSGYYSSHGAQVPASQLCLTSSTSEGYSYLFRLLCNPGDEVLIARPSYPLFDFLARLDDIRLVEYPLFYDCGWHIDLNALRSVVTERTRAVVVVHPNNPTGNFASASERAALVQLCAELSLSLIVDEVFLDYSVAAEPSTTFASGPNAVLTFVLSGLSKVCALPQMKVSWIATLGPAAVVDEAMQRLEVIADTFLSVNSPAQAALVAWLTQRGALQGAIKARLAANLRVIDDTLAGSLASRLAIQGGWTAMLRVPRTVDGVPFAEAALHGGVLLQPGEFYGASAGHVVLSLLTPVASLREGLGSLPLWEAI